MVSFVDLAEDKFQDDEESIPDDCSTLCTAEDFSSIQSHTTTSVENNDDDREENHLPFEVAAGAGKTDSVLTNQGTISSALLPASSNSLFEDSKNDVRMTIHDDEATVVNGEILEPRNDDDDNTVSLSSLLATAKHHLKNGVIIGVQQKESIAHTAELVVGTEPEIHFQGVKSAVKKDSSIKEIEKVPEIVLGREPDLNDIRPSIVMGPDLIKKGERQVIYFVSQPESAYHDHNNKERVSNIRQTGAGGAMSYSSNKTISQSNTEYVLTQTINATTKKGKPPPTYYLSNSTHIRNIKIQQHDTFKRNRRRYFSMAALITIVLSVASIVLLTLWYGGIFQMATPTTVPPTIAPITVLPSTVPTTAPIDAHIPEREFLKATFTEVSSFESLNNPMSPQGRALEWVLEEIDQWSHLLSSGDVKRSQQQQTDVSIETTDIGYLIQRYIIIVFYYATKGESWHQYNDIFLNHESNICEWPGVKCTNDQEIELMRLQSNNLQGSLPLEMFFLSTLVALDLNGNKLSGSIPSNVGSLLQLSNLNLSYNDLLGSIPSEFGQLKQLLTLELQGNDLKGNATFLCWWNLRRTDFYRVYTFIVDKDKVECNCCLHG